MTSRIVSRWSTLLMLIVSAGSLWGQTTQEPDWKQRFLTEAPKGWAKYYASARRLQGSIVNRYLVLETQQLQTMLFEFKQATGCIMFSFRYLDGKDESQKCTVVNSKYHFELGRKNLDSPWVLANVGDGPEDLKPFYRTKAYQVKGVITEPLTIYGDDDWPDILSSPDFTLLSAHLDENGLVKIEYTLRWLPTEEKPFRAVQDGRVWFDPDNCWVMRKCEFKRQHGPRPPLDRSHSYEYQVSQDSFPFLKRMVVKDFAKAKLHSETTADYNLELKDVPESDFRLSYFGIPEPRGIMWPQPIRWHLYFIAAAVVFLGLGWWLRRRIQGRFTVDPTA
jgi:hypothetical protein